MSIKTFIKIITCCILIIGSKRDSYAQDSTRVNSTKQTKDQSTTAQSNLLNGVYIDTISFNPEIDLSLQLPSIDSLLEVAILNNADVRFEEASVRQSTYNLKYTRYLWLNGLTGFFNYSYGDQTNLNTVNSDGSVLNNSLGIGYRLGVNFTLPATEIVARPARMKMLKAEVDKAKAKRDNQRMNLKRLLIQDYFNLMAAQKLLWIRTQDVESAKLTAEIATVEMKRGKIHPQELSRLKNLQALAESNLEMSKKDFMTYYYFLENWVGVKLSSLKLKTNLPK